MSSRGTARAVTAALAVLAAVVGALLVSGAPAAAHTLDSSSVRMVIVDDGLDGTISLAVAALDSAFDADQRSDVLSPAAYADQVLAYVDEHLAVRGADGTAWVETYSDPIRQTTEGIETITLDVSVAAGGADPSQFELTYDAVIESVAGHEAVLVLERPGGTVSTPGVFRAEHPTIAIGDTTNEVGFADMVQLGIHHVLDGADHLLFLLTLLLPAPMVAADRRWRRGPGLRPSVVRVVHVATAFTVGHSVTLGSSALGWVSVPSRAVEVLVAASVAVSAVHALRPLVRGGEAVIAASFGLVHGLAFAGILRDLGLDGDTSALALLAFNIGIELAQLLTIACVFPSLYALVTCDRTAAARQIGAVVALTAAGGWMLDRLGLLANPFAGVEQAIVAHPLPVVLVLAAAALIGRLAVSTTPQPT